MRRAALAGDTGLVDALQQAQQVQGVCCGYLLDVLDRDTGQFDGAFAASSVGAGTPATRAPDGVCPYGVVELLIGGRADDRLDDGRSETCRPSATRGFVLASRGAAPVPTVDPDVADGLRFLDGDVLAAATVFPKDRSLDRSVQISTLDRPRILEYEARGWRGC